MPLLVGAGPVPERRRRCATCTGRPPTPSSQAYIDLVIRDQARDRPVPPLHADPRAARLGDLDVRVVRRLRASPAAQRGRHRRPGPAREHGVRRARTSCRYLVLFSLASLFLLIRGARLRRAVGVAASADRRPGVDLVGLPARRDRLHRGRGRRRRSLLTQTAVVGAAGGGVGRRRRRAGRPVAGRSRGTSRPAGRPAQVGLTFGPDQVGRAGVEQRRLWSPRDPAHPDGHEHVLLAGGRLRQDRPRTAGAGPTRPSVARPADSTVLDGLRRRRRPDGPPSAQLHRHAGHASTLPTILSPETPVKVDQRHQARRSWVRRLLRDPRPRRRDGFVHGHGPRARSRATTRAS